MANFNAKGRPPASEKIEPKIDEILELTAQGYSQKQIAKKIGVGASTFKRYIAENEEFKVRLANSRAIVAEKLKKSLYQRAMGYETESVKTFLKVAEDGTEYVDRVEKTRYFEPPHPTCLIFALKNLAGWSDFGIAANDDDKMTRAMQNTSRVLEKILNRSKEETDDGEESDK